MTMGTTVSNSFFVGFNQAGIMVDQGHETMVSECWLAEYYWSEKHAQSACKNDEVIYWDTSELSGSCHHSTVSGSF